jgi:hypothetical protein
VQAPSGNAAICNGVGPAAELLNGKAEETRRLVGLPTASLQSAFMKLRAESYRSPQHHEDPMRLPVVG